MYTHKVGRISIIHDKKNATPAVVNNFDAFVPQLSNVPENRASFSVFGEYIMFMGLEQMDVEIGRICGHAQYYR